MNLWALLRCVTYTLQSWTYGNDCSSASQANQQYPPHVLLRDLWTHAESHPKPNERTEHGVYLPIVGRRSPWRCRNQLPSAPPSRPVLWSPGHPATPFYSFANPSPW